jgi:hypothetical protein
LISAHRSSRRPRRAALLLFAGAVVSSSVHADAAADAAAGQAAFTQGDIVGAIASYRRAAEQGYAPAQVRLGDILDYSELNEEAVAWYRKAAEQGSPAGAYGLAHMYAIGEGVKRDDAAARKWFEQAAAAGHQGALQALASAYEQGGLGVEPDPARALGLVRSAVELPGGGWAAERLAGAYARGELGLTADPARAGEYAQRVKQSSVPAP